ncbi:transposase IS200-family protein [Microseira wollei NIES-4236]|uniref:Transposase IS200-family protein n=1 Tax=Microseira wollei NIES-4236 TaxID=2530354 RepID=A0AAV3XBN9_9CYAN|nr:transposase IS200-family protein [Microseira wollei NIES-4236]
MLMVIDYDTYVNCYATNVKPTDTPHLVVKAFKGRSSYYLRREFPQLKKLPSLWTNSYFVSTAGNISSDAVKRYIEDPHHH